MLLGPGSQKAYLSDTVRDLLQLDTISKQHVQIKPFGDMKGQLKEPGGFICQVLVFLWFVGQLLDKKLNLSKVIILAVEGLHKENIDLLIWADFYWDIVDGSIKKGNSVASVALGSKLGWFLSDPVSKHNASSLTTQVENNVLHIKTTNLEEVKIDNFWKLDLLGIQEKELSVCEKVMEDIKFENNRYVVKLPFKENIPFVFDNHNVSLNRLCKLKNRLSKSTEHRQVIADQLEHGVIEKVESIGIPAKVKYLPHQAVIREDHSSTKLRAVFDASSKTIGPSLNDILYKGPCLTPLLFDALLHFHFNPIGIIADIEKTYLQISVADCYRDFLRFLWLDDIFKDIPEVIKYRFCRFIFGANCSQYVLNSVIRFHASRYKNVDKEFSEKVAKSFYVDDFNSTAKDISEGIEIYKKSKFRILDASFNVLNGKPITLIFKMENQFSPTSEIQANDKV